MKVLIGIPTYKTITTQTAFSLIELLKNTDHDVQVLFQNGVFVHENQNKIVDQSLGFDYLFLVEHDMVFEPLILDKLIKNDKEVVCASYNFKSEPSISMVFKDNGELKNIPTNELPKETFEVGAVPTGLTLIKTSVFNKLKKPYFFYEYNEDGTMKTSQDVYFSLKARDVGIKLWCNPSVETGHIGEKIF